MRLLALTLNPERGKLGRVTAVLLVTLALRLAMPALLGRFVDDALAREPLSALTAVAAIYVVLALLTELLELTVTWWSVDLSWRAGNRLREMLARHALRLDMAWHGKNSAGRLIERIDGDVEALVVFFTNVVVQILGNVILMIGMLVIAFAIDPWAGVTLMAAAAAGTVVLFRLRTAAVPAREAEREASAILYGDLEERLGGLEDLRTNGAGAFAVHKLQSNSARLWRATRRSAFAGDGSYAAAASTFAAGSVVTLALGFFLHSRDIVTVGQVLALFRYSEMLRQPMERIAEQMKEMQKALAGARRSAALLDTEPAIGDGPLGSDALPSGPLDVEFDGVTFAYDRTGGEVLHDVDLLIGGGRHVGIVGRTGSGKTTLGRLVLRLWDATDGTVRVGGVDVRQLDRMALRSTTAVVTQDVELFSASLRDNLTMFGTRDASDDEMLSALGSVGLDRWLATLPDGLDSQLRGSAGMSAGEAQLLAMARVFLADPRVVVLDEASSRLDPETEARLAVATRRLLEGRTALIIAHRLTTLDEVDEIVVVDHGRIVEHGTRAELVADTNSRFARLLALSGPGGVLGEVPA
jgi:ATP-binding cassette, subfamily B, bacterial